MKNKFFYLWLGLLLIFIPLYPKFPLFTVPGTYVAIRLEDFFLLITALFVGFLFLYKKPKPVLKEYLFKPLFIFFFFGFISVLNFIFIFQIGKIHLATLHWLRHIEYFVPLLAFLLIPISLKQLKRYLEIIILTTFLVDIYALGQKYLHWPVISTMNGEFSKGKLLKLSWLARVSSTFGGHYDLAIFLVLVLNISLAYYFYFLKEKKKVVFWSWWLLTFYILVLTASRISIASFFFTFPVIFIYKKRYLLLAFLLTITLILSFQSNNLSQRFLSLLPPSLQKPLTAIQLTASTSEEKIFRVTFSLKNGFHFHTQKNISSLSNQTNQKRIIITPTPILETSKKTSGNKPEKTHLQLENILASPSALATFSANKPYPTPEPISSAAVRSTQIRFKVEWPRAIRAFLKNPLTGTGYSSLGLSTDNDYLRMLGEVGILGSLAFFCLWGHILYLWKKYLYKKNIIFALVLISAVSSFFFTATFIDAFESSKVAYYLWSLTGLFISFALNGDNK